MAWNFRRPRVVRLAGREKLQRRHWEGRVKFMAVVVWQVAAVGVRWGTNMFWTEIVRSTLMKDCRLRMRTGVLRGRMEPWSGAGWASQWAIGLSQPLQPIRFLFSRAGALSLCRLFCCFLRRLSETCVSLLNSFTGARRYRSVSSIADCASSLSIV